MRTFFTRQYDDQEPDRHIPSSKPDLPVAALQDHARVSVYKGLLPLLVLEEIESSQWNFVCCR